MELDVRSTPLSGTHIIEASAGTGKTHSIASIYIRMIVEKKLLVRQILVVTYTESATLELKGRIRQRLLKMRAAIVGDPDETRDILEEELLRRYNREDERKEMLRRINSAILSMDEAAIYTIHAFCNRMLKDNAFEGGAPFNMTLAENSDSLLLESVEDWFRHRFYSGTVEEALFAKVCAFTPRKLIVLYKTASKAGITILPQNFPCSIDDKKAKVLTLYNELVEYYDNNSSIIDNAYGSYKNRLILLHEFVNPSNNLALTGFSDREKMIYFTVEKLQKKVVNIPEVSQFSTLFTEYFMEQNSLITAYRLDFIRFVNEQLINKKNKGNVFFYDDLLYGVSRAVCKVESEFVTVVRKRFKAALIDEFQDTNALQWSIFKGLFGSRDFALFLIGDPKQSIFSFSGADVQTYLKAKEHAEFKWQLSVNYRSTHGVVEAVNELFIRKQLSDPFFSYPDTSIAFFPSKSKQEMDLGASKNTDLWPLTISFIESPDGKQINVSTARKIIEEEIASNIAGILTINENISLKDFGILVRTNTQARAVQASLARRDIPAVLERSGMLFASREASQLAILLSACLYHENGSLIRAAASLDWFGFPIEHIMDEKILVTFQDAIASIPSELSTKGFFFSLMSLIDRFSVVERLLHYWNGERRATNLLHLIEIIGIQARERLHTLSSILVWLNQRILLCDEEENEENEIRLEKDADSVRIITIHKAKGLQYPIVFVPYSWTGGDKKNEFSSYHYKSEEYLDLDSLNKKAAEERRSYENLSEHLRLLYVALTRAEHGTVLFTGNIKGVDTSAVGYLLYAEKNRTTGYRETLENLSEKLKEMKQEELIDSIPQSANIRVETVSTQKLRQKDSEPVIKRSRQSYVQLCNRTYRGQEIDINRKITSYSRIADSAFSENIFAKKAESIMDAVINDKIFSFPAGAVEGVFFHSLFEQIDFTNIDEKFLRKYISDNLPPRARTINANDELENINAVIQMVKNVSAVSVSVSGLAQFRLNEVNKKKSISELQFFLSFKRRGMEKIKKAFAEVGHFYADSISSLKEEDVYGYLNGFIDLVFEHNGKWYIIDWKSNHLGVNKDNYSQEALQTEMAASHYVLQYHIYAAALDRYLALRLPSYSYSEHFGGIIYLFIRGIHPEWGDAFGIYTDKPKDSFMEKIISALCG